jgi:class 3 adenylate cyclase/tetratricopeptide (TPR) repeat protein
MLTCPGCGEENPEPARFCRACGSTLAIEPGPAFEVRKTVTILFCDVTGSTSLGDQQDPEQLRRVMSRYYQEARTVLERHGGQVEKFIGDAVMAVFGIPVLHEDDALRALRAALELREAFVVLNEELERSFGLRLRVRTGVNTGEVIAGDTARGHAFVSGDAVNVAQRLEAAAADGEILIGEPTYRLARDSIRVDAVEQLQLKGKPERVGAYRLLDVAPGALPRPRRFDSPMVGRDGELALLEDAFARSVRERSCHLFTLLGSAGVGKSRLLTEALRDIGTDAYVLAAACLPYGEGITFWPVREIVKQATGLTEDDEPVEALAKIVAALMGDESPDLVAQRVAEVIGVTGAVGTAEEGFWGVRRLFEGLARQRPLIVVFEDLNWAEPTLLDLIEHIAEYAHDTPILLVCLSRPELLDMRRGWSGGKKNATTIFLEPLSEEEAEALIDNLVGGVTLPAEVRARIQSASSGNPLFVEEMFSMLIDDGLLRNEDGRWVAVGDLSGVRVPPSIQLLLATRLDQLATDERRVLERAAVEGNVFHRGAVEALASEEERAGVFGCLNGLVRKELVRPHRATYAEEDGFSFRHPLIRDAAYDALPKLVRGELHEGHVAWLEGRAGEADELLGYHLEQAFRYRSELGSISAHDAGLGARAAELLALAGRRALGRGDMHAAVDLLERALALQGDESGLELLPELGAALRESGQLARAEEMLADVPERARRAGKPGIELAALVERAVLLSLSDPAQTDRLLEEIEAAVVGLDELGDDRALGVAWTVIGLRFGLWKGRVARGEEALERGLGHARRAGDRRQEATILGQLCFAALLGPTPVPDAIARCHAVLAESGGDPLIGASVARYLAPLEARRGRFADARGLADRARALYGEFGMQLQAQAATALAYGDVELLAGDYDAAERELRKGWVALEEIGEHGYSSSVAAFLAQALYGQGRLDEAEEIALHAQERASSDDIWSQALSLGIRAKVLARRGSHSEAERLTRDAIARVEVTDAIDLHGTMLLDRAEVLLLAGIDAEAVSCATGALDLFERKGNEVASDRARETLKRAGGSPTRASRDRGGRAS